MQVPWTCAKSKQCPSVKPCQDKAPNPRTDPPGRPVPRARQRSAGVEEPHYDWLRLECCRKIGRLSEHTGERGWGRQGKPWIKLIHLEGTLHKHLSTIKLLSISRIWGIICSTEVRLTQHLASACLGHVETVGITSCRNNCFLTLLFIGVRFSASLKL